ncbi:MAG TPA: hypothetical protein VI193_04585 [Acidimicrobiia bacterium]
MTVSVTETPVFFGQADEFFGISSSGPEAGSLGAVICLTPSMADNPVGSRLARKLATAGVPALRFDLAGHGHSHESRHGDAWDGTSFQAAAEWMREMAIESFVLIGGTTGANACLTASSAMTDLRGLVFNRLSTKRPVGRVSRIVRPPRGRPATPTVISQLQDVIERGVPTLVVSGAADTDQARIRRLFGDREPPLDRTSLQMATVPSRTLKGFRSVPAQEEFVDVVVRWISDLAGTTPSDLAL